MVAKLLPAKQLLHSMGDVSNMTLHRWLKDVELGFPRPIYIKGRRYFDSDEVERFKSRMAAERLTGRRPARCPEGLGTAAG